MIHQHPLAYLLGLEGIALLRAWAGEYDKAFEARLAEIRRLLDSEALVSHSGVMVNRGDTVTGYRQWSATYDEPRNTLFDFEARWSRRSDQLANPAWWRPIATPLGSRGSSRRER